MASDDATLSRNIQGSVNSSAASESSQTAQDYIAAQLSLEADAREALPYQFDTCTKPLGPLRQSVYACLTCTPPPASPHQQFTPAGVCYSCSISCHGEHNLVELFTKRDFECDCGTTRFSNSGTPCSLRSNAHTGQKGGVTGEEARKGNKYNQNFQGKFCGCGEEYDPEKEKGTMFQCIGLGHVEDGGCGEDWWHPECLMGLPRMQSQELPEAEPAPHGPLETVLEEPEDGAERPPTNDTAELQQAVVDELPLPPGFPAEDDFDHFICYKCVHAYPWVKRYAGTDGVLPAVLTDGSASSAPQPTTVHAESVSTTPTDAAVNKKRKAEDEAEYLQEGNKKAKPDTEPPSNASTAVATETLNDTPDTPRHSFLPVASSSPVSLFLKEDFRDHFCRCPECFPSLSKHRQLLEEEDTYEPPVSESDHDENASINGRSVGSGCIYDRGEAVLSSMDRVRAIEGVMAYNHVRDKVKALLQPFAESGQAIGAEDINAYFAKLRGDEAAQRETTLGASSRAV